jgi:hypothetical protein
MWSEAGHTICLSKEELLFSSGDLGMTLEAQRQRARQAVDQWDPEQLLVATEADIVDYLVSEYTVACPILHRDQIEQLPVSEEVQSPGACSLARRTSAAPQRP